MKPTKVKPPKRRKDDESPTTILKLSDLKPLERPPASTEMPLEVWLNLLDIFRKQHPINYTAAAAEAGVSQITAKKAFVRGNARLERPAIRDILLLEAREARTESERRFEKLSGTKEDRLYANREAVQIRAQEGQLVHGVAVTAGALQQITALLISGLKPLAERARMLMQDEAQKDDLDLARVLRVFRDIRDLAKGAADIVQQKMTLERILKGDPEAIAAVTGEITPAEAVAELRASERILERLKRSPDTGEMAKALAEAGVPLRMILGGKHEEQKTPPAPDEAPPETKGATS